ncbi:MAG: FAD-dependent oxidoreductase [Nanoarchaeota archaeon]|nr:FAD-dependent oxidoreductase [Nanoarchaeota archaeon]
MKKVVIIGGGFAGSYAAKKLQRDFDVTLIDTKDYFEFTPSILRTIVEPKHIKKIQVLHRHYLPHARIVTAEVNDVTTTDVLTTKQKIAYDYLIISSGSSYTTPIKEKNTVIANRAATLRNYTHILTKAKKVLIIGGGLVGVELAAEIVDCYPGKEVTIIHAHENLITRHHPKAVRHAQRFLQQKGVTIIYNQRMVENKDGYCFTNKGVCIEHDIIFICTGIKANSSFLHHNFSAIVNQKQQLKVNNYLQVLNYQTIFAAGDITDRKEEKTAQNAEMQAALIVRNIFHVERKEKLEQYHSAERPMVISLGKRNGIFTYKNIVITGIIPAFLKTMIEWKTMRRYK